MVNLTENEIKLLDEIRYADFNGDEIDFSKTWEEQVDFLESQEHYFTIVDTKSYSKGLKTTKAVIKGLLGSLAKKDLVTIIEDVDPDGKPMSWLYINKEQFNMIKESLEK